MYKLYIVLSCDEISLSCRPVLFPGGFEHLDGRRQVVLPIHSTCLFEFFPVLAVNLIV